MNLTSKILQRNMHLEYFENARLRLTFIYSLILTCVLIFFSFAIYGFAMAEVYDRVKDVRIQLREEYGFLMRPEKVIVIDTDALNKARKNIILRLVIANSVIIIVTALGSYYLAGRTLQPIQDMTRKQQEFIANASHELRTPLTAIMTSSEVALRDPNLSLAEAKTTLQDALEESTRLQGLIHNLLLLATADSQSEVITESSSIDELVQTSLKRIRHKAEEKQIQIHTTIAPINATLNTEISLEVLLILLENAIKYSPNNSVVKITSLKKKNQVLVQITDQGIGISQPEQQHVFDRFYRAESSRTSEGYGLGLSIAAQLMELQGGNITVQSLKGSGSTFTLSFPIT